MSKNDNIIALFSGAGGLSLGFSNASLKPSYAADIDPEACLTYANNLSIEVDTVDLGQPGATFFNKLRPYTNPFAIIGGPPCQGFSSAGRKNSADPRNSLVFSYLTIINFLRPRWFLFENVEGLLTSNKSRSAYDLVRQFMDLGYNVRLEKVNFAGFGLPQARKRVIIIGNAIGADCPFPEPTHSFNAGKHKSTSGYPLSPSLRHAISGLGPAKNDWSTLSGYASTEPVNGYDALMRKENPSSGVWQHVATIPAGAQESIAALQAGQTMKDLPPEYWHDSYKRRAFRRVSDGTPTEKRGGAPSGIKRLQGHLNSLTITSAAPREFIHPDYDRPLSLRECARLQSFPDHFLFEGRFVSMATQIGNAFPPLAAEVFANHLQQLDGSFGGDRDRYATDGRGKLLGYRLTEAAAMSPALAKTDTLLSSLMEIQGALPFDQEIEEVA